LAVEVVAGSRSKSRGRGRSRKRRPAPDAAAAQRSADSLAGTSDAVVSDGAPVARSASNRDARRARRSARDRPPFRDPLSVGERPQAPWHPWPLSELLILVGAIGTIIGLQRASQGGLSSGGPVLFAGLAAVALGTIEVTLREHRAGYRSHTLILAFLPVLIFDTVVVLTVSAFTTVPRLFSIGLLAVDAALFVALFKLWRARFLEARARVISRR
jgi:hypothetical protein